MRPLVVAMEGFTAFRAPTEVDFDGVELFALSGPTGSGKTSVLDAIVFALYGSIPRLAEGAVAPVVAQGMVEARVRLDFLVGSTAYTATRVVRRNKRGGASTEEARLERGGEVLAGNADEVTAAIVRLLGLSYKHFTRCVVLPQGDFARFLHDAPKDRQELLVSLLDLGLYGRIAGLAGQRSGLARGEVAALDGQLGRLGHATAAAVEQAAARVDTLKALVSEIDAALPALAQLEAEATAASAAAAQLEEEAARLVAVRVPDGLDALAAATNACGEELRAATLEVEASEAAVAAAEGQLRGGPEPAALTALLAALDQRDALVARREQGDQVLADRRAAAEAATEAMTAAETALQAATEGRRRAEAAHRAHAVRADLVAGQPCPVCEQPVAKLPAGQAPPALSKAQRQEQSAERECRQARGAAQDAGQQLAKAEATMAAVLDDLAAVGARLSGAPDRGAVLAGLEEAKQATEALAAARRLETGARRRQAAAADAVAEVEKRTAGARDEFDAARDSVAALGSPARLGRGAALADEWAALAAWAEAEGTVRRQAAIERAARARSVTQQREERLRALAQRCAGAGVEVAGGVSARDAAVDAVAKAEAALAQLRRDVAMAAELTEQRAAAEERRAVAASLATHLDARHFEKWVLDEALRGLATGATELLLELSGGQYSLEVDKTGFAVVDHRNADERRSTRTLSGGETFLTSLALALALADRIASLAAGGAARLDSIFLDEGFGTLDHDTLDVVASALEELGSRGRMVGVVSHVAELAERLPVRFDVTKVGNAATVVRVDQ